MATKEKVAPAAAVKKDSNLPTMPPEGKEISEMTPDERFMAGSAAIKAVLEKYHLSIVPMMEMQDTKPKPAPVIDMPPAIEILKG